MVVVAVGFCIGYSIFTFGSELEEWNSSVDFLLTSRLLLVPHATDRCTLPSMWEGTRAPMSAVIAPCLRASTESSTTYVIHRRPAAQKGVWACFWRGKFRLALGRLLQSWINLRTSAYLQRSIHSIARKNIIQRIRLVSSWRRCSVNSNLGN